MRRTPLLEALLICCAIAGLIVLCFVIAGHVSTH